MIGNTATLKDSQAYTPSCASATLGAYVFNFEAVMSRARVSEDILRAHLAHTAGVLGRLAHIVARAEALAQRSASEDLSWGDVLSPLKRILSVSG